VRRFAVANSARFTNSKNPNSPEYRLITRRRVIYVSGYDPQGPQGYYSLFGSQLKRACALWHAKFALGPLVMDSADIASWSVTTGGPNWQVFTQYDFVRQEDIINANCAEPIIRQISRGVRWMLDDLATGTTFRVFRANWQFGMHHLVLQLLLLTWIACPYRKSNPDVLMMQTSKNGPHLDAPGALNEPFCRRILT